ncbi:hypothetical protein [Erwinia phage Zoomie]|uniref:Uncharacterized protein n=1 Tax=Erwinia phage Zoomie TaxID=2851072 RepID=A0A9E6N8G3_9CAUD|nr:hypothetical protein [Erwinia phage Zoomie]
MKIIKSVKVEYISATGEPVFVQRAVGPVAFAAAIKSVRIRWAGGAGGTFRVYCSKEDGTLSVAHIPQHRIVDVFIEYMKEAR